MMVNQRGQAFSVFELVIAAVVAFAILVVLLPIIVPPEPPGTAPKDAIATSIKTVGTSGEVTSKDFMFNKNGELTSGDLATVTGLDSKSMFFASGVFGNDSKIKVGVSDAGEAYIRYVGVEDKFKARAKVICKANATSLDESISRLDSAKYTFEVSATSYCGEEFSPCCVAILERTV